MAAGRTASRPVVRARPLAVPYAVKQIEQETAPVKEKFCSRRHASSSSVPSAAHCPVNRCAVACLAGAETSKGLCAAPGHGRSRQRHNWPAANPAT
jgi:hypothetical protein